ncbi:MAG: alpha/beta hydrolase [Proteobacteria bacterium]|nr:alpha/beta hydrolase [Pseudomonadota bacterium]
MSEHVILVHGLWMRAFTLAALHRRLEREGYIVHFFDYASVLGTHDTSVDKLVEFARAISRAEATPERIHFVCHSLGGLMTLRALRKLPGLAPGSVVCLGSPLRGSAIARSVAQLPGGAFFIGKNLDVLLEGLERWDGKRPVGAIAGRLPFGLGLVFGALPMPHDGTVSVEETQLPGICDHIVVPATHTGLLFSDETAAQTVAFLRNKRFQHPQGT